MTNDSETLDPKQPPVNKFNFNSTWDGRMCDIKIEIYKERDEATGWDVPSSKYDYVIWADNGLRQLLETIPGVHNINSAIDKRYLVKVDVRYDRDYVREEIRRVILCRPDLLDPSYFDKLENTEEGECGIILSPEDDDDSGLGF